MHLGRVEKAEELFAELDFFINTNVNSYKRGDTIERKFFFAKVYGDDIIAYKQWPGIQSNIQLQIEGTIQGSRSAQMSVPEKPVKDTTMKHWHRHWHCLGYLPFLTLNIPTFHSLDVYIITVWSSIKSLYHIVLWFCVGETAWFWVVHFTSCPLHYDKGFITHGNVSGWVWTFQYGFITCIKP